MAGNLERALAVLELLAKNGGRMPLATIADTLNIPRSGTHRLLSMLIDEGFVRQDEEHGEYLLAMKLVSLALIYLSTSGVFDISQPVLDRLAEASGELARLGVVEGDHLTFVGKAQGAKSGLRYDPDMGSNPPLHCTASGQAWLATLPDERAIELVSRQGGLGAKTRNAPRAPKTIQQFLKDLNGARQRGYGVAIETYEAGMTSIAAAVRNPVTHEVVGIVSLAGPSTRLPESRLKELAPHLLEAATDMGAATLTSRYFKQSTVAGADRT
ncbi:IclR family transcriptional regulator [Paraburkholderia sp. Ac-20336]|uniref:IclR family transcriptional regulator n=1 Tax=Paraburkholderia sp. Ac-20336 TaxID=2703886 RepID=UPI00197F2604|nr:IclR family transcriptional regulator [Paraburkholderia sp. Ac-20336]MBN3804788.1 IclR family transcriptional regulator [Paraburkholderia sp. Ac-20336]